MIEAEELLGNNGDRANRATLDRPLEHLMACHRRIEQRLDTLERAAEHLQDRPAEAMEAIRNCFHFLDTSGVLHTEDEELSLFPRLRPVLNTEESDFIRVLEFQHGEADATLAELRHTVAQLEAAGDESLPPSLVHSYQQASRAFCRVYRAHIDAEDNVLMEISRRLLTEDALRAISGEMKQRRLLDQP